MPIHITSNTKLLRLKPTSKKQLRSIIEQELERQGPDADLNFIDTSLITDMSMLFWWIKIGNIKIDEWDVSNVTNMIAMFTNQNFKCDLSGWDVSNVTNMYATFEGCKNLNCDLSGWDVSNVTDMRWMFDNCDSFKSDLSGWDVSNVNKYNNMFDKCPNMTADLQPKFN